MGLPAIRPHDGARSDTMLRAAYWADSQRREMELGAQTDSRLLKTLIGGGAAVAGAVALIHAVASAAGPMDKNLFQPVQERLAAAEERSAARDFAARQQEIDREVKLAGIAARGAERDRALERYRIDSAYADLKASREHQRWASEFQARGEHVLPQSLKSSTETRKVLLF